MFFGRPLLISLLAAISLSSVNAHTTTTSPKATKTTTTSTKKATTTATPTHITTTAKTTSSVKSTSTSSVHSSSAPVQCASAVSSASAAQASSFAAISFDYVIIGGGTAGLALANRLTSGTSLKVGVIEAGVNHPGDPTLDVPANSLPGGQGNATYDWLFETVPQPGANNASIPQPRGKMMGGSSGLNLLGWNRASSSEYDAWATFADDNSWSWSSLQPYFAAAQNVKQGQANPFPGTSSSQVAQSFTHGSVTGPINVSYNVIYSDVVPDFVKSWNNLGVPTLGDADSGNTAGVWNSRMSISRGPGIRSYASDGYYAQSCARTNLHALTGAQATKISFKKTSSGYAAQSVDFVVGGKTYTAKAGKEVILSAGSVKTPQLLELSGIGDSTLLKSLGITPLINLPQVGENLQEHVFSIVEWELVDGLRTFDQLTNNATFLAEQTALYQKNGTGWLAANDGALTFLPFQYMTDSTQQKALLAAFDANVESCGSSLTPLQKAQYTLQREWIQAGNVPMTESIMLSRGLIAPEAGKSYLTMLTGTQHPMARGSIHINSSVATAAPVINGNYLDNDFDVQTILTSFKFLLKLAQTAPLSNLVAGLVVPPATDDDSLIAWIRSTLSVGDHLLGTAAMATQELGGVVDGTLTVYGTTNLRVVDASIMPYTLATHLQSTVYAIAEKAAAMILSSN